MANAVNEITQKLLKSHDTKQPIEFIRHTHTLSEETAYSIQEEFIKRKCKLENDKVAGYKISMTSAETQAIASTHEPAYGTLLASHVINSGDSIPLESLFSPMIEPEIIFILTENLTPEADEEEILNKSKIAPGIEVPDARYIDWFPNFSLADLLSDNTATGLVVVADEIDPLSFEKMANINMELAHNGEKISEGLSSAVLENPVSSIAWLAKKLAKKGKTLEKDMVISSGTFIPPLPVEKGTYTVKYSRLGQAEITFV
ncbi:2-keto-4-pentenoate hydratase [Virgibacillus sp. MSJ-26]|uniref:2-keto-4-pentenoate hydratase n=1 Tax=Virgibacillus sp. MSJ-26 TaxID=2841522 RepID=UPI001C115FFB|nr:2-keto-4-pentenoate hydratase [Virgibacillus sp. MSJ-26]MBU5467056.1 2-keto-4-pentenoate hydratase [Virgibacillus sp. MSJ-26]